MKMRGKKIAWRNIRRGMSRSTFLHWLNRYAYAVKELSWVGGKYDENEREEVKTWCKQEKRLARRKLLDAAGLR